MTEPSATARVEIAAPAERVYELVSDLPGMARMAEEFRGGRWLGAQPGAQVGARFRGHNRRGWHRWSTTSTVTEADRGRRFGFDVRSMWLPVSHWEYAIEPTDGGCQVTESTWDRRPAWFRPLAGFATGSMNRAEVNQHNIERTLERLKSTAEAVTK
jgi:hypothetical protein